MALALQSYRATFCRRRTLRRSRQRFGVHDARGISAVEMLVVVGIIGVMAAVSMTSLVGYWRASTLTAGAADLRVILNSARQLAIRQNTDVCVEHGVPRVRLRLGGCAGEAWTGPRTDSSGWFRLVNEVEVASANASVTFSSLGAASPGGTYTVRKAGVGGQVLTVTVAVSGRISIP